jgi:hypothetical protein
MELMVCEPEVILLPLQSPDAVQLSALPEDQDKVILPLLATDAILELRLMVTGVGAWATLILTVLLCTPLLPVQFRVKLRLAVSKLSA